MSVTKLRDNQAGVVSILVTMVMIIIITLIVVGFSQVVVRNQREALDRQLSSQAYYAAETGANDAFTAAKSITPGQFDSHPGFSTDCNAFKSFAGLDSHLAPVAGNDVQYTCLLVSDKNSTVDINVPYGDSKVADLDMTGTPGSLSFQWDVGQAGAPLTCTSNLTPSATWTSQCPYGILRLDLYDASGALDAETMAAHTASVFMMPTKVGGTTAITFGDPDNDVFIAKAKCNASHCTGTLSGFSGQHYYARLSSVYEGVGTVMITPSDPTVKFGGYLQVDSTGKAQDVLRRVVVHYPIGGETDFPIPSVALASSASICKRFTTLGSGHTANDGPDTPSSIESQLCAGL